jgi:hypothetical protein
LVLGILYGVQDKFPDDVSGAAVGPETSPENLFCTPCKIPKTKNRTSIFSTDFRKKLKTSSSIKIHPVGAKMFRTDGHEAILRTRLKADTERRRAD